MKFLKSLGKCVAIALVFGLVAGSAFTGVGKLWDVISPETETGDDASKDKSGDDSTDAKSVATDSDSKSIASTDTTSGTTVTDVSEMVENTMPSIVAITNVSEQEYRSFFMQGYTQTYESTSCGSGIIIGQDDSYIYIVTNNHVVEGATTLTVEFYDSNTATAEIKGTEASADLAVVQVPVSELTSDTISTIRVATLGDSDELQVGETAVAIGNALGYGQSVTTGVISALNRSVTVTDSSTGTKITNLLIQTDAAINPGNSGGALLNVNGEVIGINSSKYSSSSSSSTSVEGMGFAYPINDAKEIISAIINNTIDELEDAKGYLGITGIDVDSQSAQKYNMPVGVYIAKVVDDTAASAAGLTKGQIITAVDGTEVTSSQTLSDMISKYKQGDSVTLTIMTNNGSEYVESEVTVTLGGRGDMEEQTASENPENDMTGNGGNSNLDIFR